MTPHFNNNLIRSSISSSLYHSSHPSTELKHHSSPKLNSKKAQTNHTTSIVPSLPNHIHPIQDPDLKKNGDRSSAGITAIQPHSSADQQLNSSMLGPAPLKRNMACLTCRKRKLRCDAARPVCGTCAKSRTAAAVAKHPTSVPDGDCVYADSNKIEDCDSSSQCISAPTKRTAKRRRELSVEIEIKEKDAKIVQLESQLRCLQVQLAQQQPIQAETSQPDRNLTQPFKHQKDNNPIASSSSPPCNDGESIGNVVEPNPVMELLWSGYPSDLPPPDTILHLSETFFACSPYRNVVYKPAYMTGLSLPRNHPERPHSSLIHAILALAAPFSPYFYARNPTDNARVAGARRPQRFELLFGFSQLGQQHPSARQYAGLSFCEYHLAKARIKAESAFLAESRNPLDWFQSLLLIVYQFRVEERALEAFLLSAILSRLTTPTGLTRLPSHWDRTKPYPNSYLEPPQSAVEEHERRSYFWHLWLIDAYTSGSSHFWHSVFENDAAITTSFPIRMAEFQRGDDPPPNPQTLNSPDLFRNIQYDDSFLLHLKSAYLLKQTFKTISMQTVYENDITLSPGFIKLENDLSDFLNVLPPSEFTDSVDVELMLAITNTHTAVIHMYRDIKGVKTQGPQSVRKAKASILSIVRIAYQLNASSFDLGLLHYRVFNGFAMAAKAICHEINDKYSATSNPTNDNLLVEALQALDAILAVLRRAEEKIPHASRFEKLLSQFRSGGWSKDVIDHSLIVYQVSRKRRWQQQPAQSSREVSTEVEDRTPKVKGPSDWQFRTTKYSKLDDKVGYATGTLSPNTTPSGMGLPVNDSSSTGLSSPTVGIGRTIDCTNDTLSKSARITPIAPNLPNLSASGFTSVPSYPTITDGSMSNANSSATNTDPSRLYHLANDKGTAVTAAASGLGGTTPSVEVAGSGNHNGCITSNPSSIPLNHNPSHPIMFNGHSFPSNTNNTTPTFSSTSTLPPHHPPPGPAFSCHDPQSTQTFPADILDNWNFF